MRSKNKEGYSLNDGGYHPGSRKGKALGAGKKILISTAILVVIFTLFGFGYALWTNMNGSDAETLKAEAAASKAADVKPFVAKPSKPSPNAPVGVAVYLESQEVKAGTNTSATTRSVAGANCTVVVAYNGVVSHDSGLGPKKADDYGTVHWTWTVEAGVPAGSWPVTVTCAYNGRTGVGMAKMTVTN